MNRSFTIFLLLTVLLLGAGIFFLRPMLSSAGEFRGTGGYLLDFSLDDVTGITVRQDAGKMEFEREADGWVLGPDPKDSASSLELGRLLSSVQNLRILDAIPSREFDGELRDEDYGFTDSKTGLRLRLKGGVEKRLDFGREGAVPGTVFVRLGESRNTYLVGAELTELLQQPIAQFRERRLVPLPVTKFEKLLITTSGGEVEMERKGDRWQILRPLQAGADSAAVDRLLELVLGAAILEFRDSEPKTSGGEWRGEIQLWTEIDAPSQRIRLGRREGGELEVFSTARMLAALVPAENFLLFEVPLQELRDKHLLEFSSDLVDRVKVEMPSGEFVLLRSPENQWEIKTKSSASGVEKSWVEELLESLRSLKVLGYLPLPADGFGESALLGIDLLSWVSENTPEALAGAHPVHSLGFYGSETGVLVRIDGEPELRRISEEDFHKLQALAQRLCLEEG